MNDQDRARYRARYEEWLETYGPTPQALGWGEEGRQEVRFGVLAHYACRQPSSSILDVGCGFADLYSFLTSRGWRGRYTGIDIVPGLLDVARERHPEIEIRELDLSKAHDLGSHDHVVASGVFNARLVAESNEAHIARSLAQMMALARQTVNADFLSTRVDFQKPGAWHSDPSWVIGEALASGYRFVLRHDYMPYEFALTLFKDDTIAPSNDFAAHSPP